MLPHIFYENMLKVRVEQIGQGIKAAISYWEYETPEEGELHTGETWALLVWRLKGPHGAPVPEGKTGLLAQRLRTGKTTVFRPGGGPFRLIFKPLETGKEVEQ